MIIKIEKYDQIKETFEETKQEASIPDAKTLAEDERIHVCFHDENPPRPCKVIKKS